MTSALDGADVKGLCGRDLFTDYTVDDKQIFSQVKGGRGLVVAPNISKPVITDYCVVCCCLNLAHHLMQYRNSRGAHPSLMKVTTMWNHLVTSNCMFAKNLTEEDSKICGEKALQVGKICMLIKQSLNHERALLILRTPTIPGFSREAIKKTIEYSWIGEVQKRLGDSFDVKKYVDIMVPIRVSSHWVLLVIDFAQRATKLICFKKETYDLPLEKLGEFATHIWRTAS
jgi:hypothetical protein